MPSFLVANCMSVSAPAAKSTAIFRGFVQVVDHERADVGLMVECKDFRASSHLDAGWTSVQDGNGGALVVVARPGVKLERLKFTPVTPAKAETGGKRRKVGPRGILSVLVDGQRFNVGHAPLGWTGMRDHFLTVLAAMDGISVGDFNAGRRDVERIFAGRTIHGGRPGVIYATVPADQRTALDVIGKGLNGADHEALLVTNTATVVTPPKPTQPQQPEEPNMLPSTIAQTLRENGLKVVEVDGWRERGRPGLFRPGGVTIHHTATSTRSSDASVVDLLRRGRSDLPGPLCHFGLSRDGTVYVVAAGRANHSGKAKASGTMVGGDGNQLYIGIEAFNDGVGERWPSVQYDAYVRLAAVLCVKVTGNSEQTVRGHKETSVTGKIDPRFDMNAFRADVKAVIDELKNPIPPRVTPKESRLATLRAQLLEDLKSGDLIPKNRPAAQAWLKRVREAVNSGPKS